ncbi:unnamed protein product [Kluyveromyces dobzhanskii CBS 2104]|uniref:WGS project CCBQ000000000 data, contig 00016 n=1 Tax=Kluyveromyces dobzhanskii CBS 2104 TaxID=1427455 RepID=A0A0A8KZN0_9SACH|nr:unnamed protein product [Kluyveromyces dobzhanskii CBS 2104]
MRYFFEYHYWIRAVHVWVEHDGDDLISHEISTDGKHLNVHSSKKGLTVVDLPCAVKSNSKPVFQKNKLWNIRLNAAGKDKAFDRSSNYIMESLGAKWMRKDLVKHPFSFDCKCCSSPLISSVECERIRDMPSEFWAEFMDYWHCHKPDVQTRQHFENNRDGNDSDEGGITSNTLFHRYSSPLMPSIGEIVLGDSFMYIHKDWIPEKLAYDGNIVRSKQCNTEIGSLTKDGIVKIGKWMLRADVNNVNETFDFSNYVLYQIINELKAHSTRLFHLKEGNEEAVIWVFGIGSSIKFGETAIQENCLKILYREGQPTEVEQNQIIEKLTFEETNSLQVFLQRLESINNKLPSELNHMSKWKVSYISCE